MASDFSKTTERRFFAASPTAGARGIATVSAVDVHGLETGQLGGAGGASEIRPFRANFPESALADLRRRLAQTRLPDKELVGDFSQGVPLKTQQQVLRHWQTAYDWRKCEERINAHPNFITAIDGLDIHFIHARSKHDDAMPLIITHGWPGSIIEQLKIIDPLINPEAHGGKASDAFHVIIPSMPGYGFSAKPTELGWGAERIASAWTTLVRRLGYRKFVATGGDWGALVTEQIGVQAPPELAGIHTNMPGAVPEEINGPAFLGAPAPAGLTAEELKVYDGLVFFYQHVYYAFFMGTRPQTLSGLADSPMGLATFMMDHDARSLEMIARSFGGVKEGLTPDDVLDNATLFWLTNTGVSSSRLYWENKLPFFTPKGLKVPVAVSVFPDELYATPRNWAERAFPKLVYYNRHPKGGHFAAWEQPDFLVHDLREGFRSLRSA